MANTLPHSRQPVVDGRAIATEPWYAWFRRLEDLAGAGAISGDAAAKEIAALARLLGSPDGSVAGIPPLDLRLTFSATQSVRVFGGSGAYTIALDGDTTAPPPVGYFGTSSKGARGWRALTSDGSVTVAPIDTSDGDSTVLSALDPLAVYLVDENGAVMRDENGFPMMSEPASTSQLPEGSNLYFTADRARAAVVVDSIADGDATHAPSRNAVFDALASKFDKAGGSITGQTVVNLNAQPLPFAYSTSPLVAQGPNDAEYSLFFHGFQSAAYPLASGVNIAPRMARGTAAAPLPLDLGDHYGGMIAAGYNGSTYVGAGRNGWQARGLWSSTSTPSRHFIQTTDVGSTVPVSRVYIEPNGDAELIVGRFYGAGLHNHSLGATPATQPQVASGTYTPTYTQSTNCAGVIAYQAQWIRVGNVVTVSGRFDVSATTAAGAATSFFCTLPIASNLTDVTNLAGTAALLSGTYAPVAISADAAGDRAFFRYQANQTGSAAGLFHFTYLIQ